MGLPLFSSLFHPHPDHLFLSLIASSGASSGRWPEWQDFRVSPRDLLFKNREQAALFFTLKREDLNLLRQCFDGRAQLGHLATACGPEVGFEFVEADIAAIEPVCRQMHVVDGFVGLALSGPSGMKLRPPFPLRFVDLGPRVAFASAPVVPRLTVTRRFRLVLPSTI